MANKPLSPRPFPITKPAMEKGGQLTLVDKWTLYAGFGAVEIYFYAPGHMQNNVLHGGEPGFIVHLSTRWAGGDQKRLILGQKRAKMGFWWTLGMISDCKYFIYKKICKSIGASTACGGHSKHGQRPPMFTVLVEVHSFI